jgi:glutamyl-tRNA reductase
MTVTRHMTLEGLVLLGVSHRTAPFETLERLALSPEEVNQLYAQLARDGQAQGALVLSTCNRTEIYAHASDGHLATSEYLTERLRAVVGPARFPERDIFYRHGGHEGAQHMFRVAAGLDSMILGEQQILGQLKSAYATAGEHLSQGTVFDKVVQSAFKVGARARSETEIGRGAVSTASAAVHLATRIYGDMSRCCVVVVGAGETGRLLAQHFAAQYPQRLIVLNRTLERAEVIAREVSGEAAPLANLAEILQSANIVATAVRTASPIITAAMLRAAVDKRSGAPLAVVDLGLPRNVDVAANELANVFVQDLQALQTLVDVNLAKRKKAVPDAEALITDELSRLDAWGQALSAGPLISALREAVEAVRAGEVERATRGMSQSQREAVDRATRAVVNKLLHGPMTSIKEYARQDEGGERIKVIQDVFRHLRPTGGDDDEMN